MTAGEEVEQILVAREAEWMDLTLDHSGDHLVAALRVLARTVDEMSDRIYYLENRQSTADDYEWEMRDRA